MSQGEEDKPLEENLTPKVKVGDYIQWTSQGVEQFLEPKRVRWICDDGSHLTVDGSTNGIPSAEVTVVEPPVPPKPPLWTSIKKPPKGVVS